MLKIIIKYFHYSIKVDLEESLKKHFREMDINNSGSLTAQEIKDSWTRLGIDITKSQVVAAIKAFDNNGDKKISLQGNLSFISTSSILIF